jgi:hypothetical protein
MSDELETGGSIDRRVIVIELDTLDKSEGVSDLKRQLNIYKNNGFEVHLMSAISIFSYSEVLKMGLPISTTWTCEDIAELGCTMAEVRYCSPVNTLGSILLDDKALTLEEFTSGKIASVMQNVFSTDSKDR